MDSTKNIRAVKVQRQDSTKTVSLNQEESVEDGAEGAESIEFAGVIPGYELKSLLGRGGMGAVYEAEQIHPARRVAIKVMTTAHVNSENSLRFQIEREVLGQMDHPNIARVYQTGMNADRQPYIAMELVRGLPITSYAELRRLGLTERLRLMINVCRGIQHAHQKGVIHRDLKPTNILVAEIDGKPVPKIIDFGIAKFVQDRPQAASVTQYGSVTGTPLYMAPEQANPLTAGQVDSQADVFALGVVLFELIAGQTPLNERELSTSSSHEVIKKVIEQQPVSPRAAFSAMTASERAARYKLLGNYREELDWIVLRCLQTAPRERYASAEQFASELERYLNHQPVIARPASRWYLAQKFIRRNRLTVVAGTAIALMFVLGSIGTTIGLIQAEKSKHDLALAVAAEQQAKNEAESERQRAEFDRLAAIAARKESDQARHEADRARQQALDSKKEAEKARDQAHQSYLAAIKTYSQFTFEFQTKLEYRPGMQELRASLLKSARAGLEELTKTSANNEQSHHIMAWSHLHMGDIEQSLGKIDLAIREYEIANDFIDRLLANNANSFIGQHDRCAMKTKLADCYKSKGDIGKAQQMYEEVLAGREQFLVAEPKNPTLIRDRNLLWLRLGDLHRFRGEYRQAKDYFEKKQRSDQELVAAKPDDLLVFRDATLTINRLGDIAMETGDYRRAEKLFQQLLDNATKYNSQDATNDNWKRDLSIAYLRLGQVAISQQQFARAQGFLENALTITQELLANDPKHLLYLSDLCVRYETLAESQLGRREFQMAKDTLLKALKERERICAHEPGNSVYQNDLAQLLDRLAEVAIGQGQFADARRHLTTSLELRKKLFANNPTNHTLHREVSISYERLGECYSKEHQYAKAIVDFEKAIQIRQQLVERHPKNSAFKHDLSIVLEYLGDSYRKQLDLEKATEKYAQALAQRKQHYQEFPSSQLLANDLMKLYFKNGLGALLYGKVDAAENYFRTGRQILQPFIDRNHMTPQFKQAMQVFDQQLLQCRLLQDSIPDLEKVFRTNHDSLPNVLTNRVRYFIYSGDTAEAYRTAQRLHQWASAQMADRNRLLYQAVLGYSLCAGGKTAEPKAVKASVSLLNELHANGYFVPERLREVEYECDLKWLRPEPGFEQWYEKAKERTIEIPSPRVVE